jgi:hypothetical protein
MSPPLAENTMEMMIQANNDRCGYRTDLCGVSFEKEAIHTMSLCVAFVDHSDGVIAADGRLIRQNAAASERVIKTMRLNDSLAVGFVGRMGEIRQVQKAIAPDYDWHDSVRFCQDWEDGEFVVKCGFKTARDRIKASIEKIRKQPPPTDEPGVGVLLLGRARGKPILWGWDSDKGSDPLENTHGFMAIGARPPDGSDELREFIRIIVADESAKNVERRLESAIRYCAHDLGYYAVNGNVFTRRLSERFALSPAAPKG